MNESGRTEPPSRVGATAPLARSAMRPEYVAGLSDAEALTVGLISDTHIPEARPVLWPQAFECLAGSDVILHGGDIHDLALLDELERIAPVFAARGNGEDGGGGRPMQAEDHRLRPAWLIKLGGLTVGLVHEIPIPEIPPYDTVQRAMMRTFGTLDVDVVVYGDTHVERLDTINGTLYVNPGSPTYPHNLMCRFGTVAVMTITERRATVSVLQLTAAGHESFTGKLWHR